MTKVIHEAKLAEVIDLGDNTARFVVKPLVKGYGNTLGNSIRRVLLSSIRGSAITSFSIDGATHEYTTIPGVKEDVVDIMLNLKNVRVKSASDAPVELTLTKKGSGLVTAADIKLVADIEIANLDQIICTIDDPKAELKMRLVVDSGRGYMTIDESADNRVHGEMIALDAVFTPVLRARYTVESTRVGQDSDLQQLSLTITTDGTIAPREAFEEAAAILVNQYTALAGGVTVETAPAPGLDESLDDAGLSRPIEELNFSARTANSLVNNNIRVIRDLVMLSEADLKELKGFGEKALNEVKEKLTELNI
jgi:DNA-directed RNA polymerase subunit alpha